MTMLPPPVYDHPPSIPVIEHVMSLKEIQAYCSVMTELTPAPGQEFKGCAKLLKEACHVWIIEDKLVRRHEYGHCNGWPKDHRGGVEARR